jgi:hypothetical protein
MGVGQKQLVPSLKAYLSTSMVLYRSRGYKIVKKIVNEVEEVFGGGEIRQWPWQADRANAWFPRLVDYVTSCKGNQQWRRHCSQLHFSAFRSDAQARF